MRERERKMGVHAIRRARLGLRAACITLGVAATQAGGCEPGPTSPADPRGPAHYAPEVGYARPGLCARPGDDAIRDLFCAATDPGIRGLADLQHRLGLHPGAGTEDRAPVASEALVDTVVFLAHSTALSGRLVSPINPRAIVFGEEAILTFQRGVQQVEIAAQARDRGFNFYLVSFAQACNQRPGGCLPGDLYTPRVEADWTQVSLRDDEDLENTALDCRQCHQRGRDDAVLLMRELEFPWTHYFEPELAAPAGAAPLPGPRGRDLLLDYLRAKGDEPYAGVSSFALRHTMGGFLQNVVTAQQPLLFDAPRIEEERWPFGPSGYPEAPLPSASWERAYRAFQRGEQLALPYFEPRATDPAKQARLTAAYQAYRRGELAAEALPDLSDVFPDDPGLRARIGLSTEPDAAPAALLIQACGSCHNDVLDQTLSRARFNVDLARMSQRARDLAISRIERPADDPRVMPPPEFRQLDPAGRARLIAYLRAPVRSPEDDAALAHAASAGMAGGQRP